MKTTKKRNAFLAISFIAACVTATAVHAGGGDSNGIKTVDLFPLGPDFELLKLCAIILPSAGQTIGGPGAVKLSPGGRALAFSWSSPRGEVPIREACITVANVSKADTDIGVSGDFNNFDDDTDVDTGETRTYCFDDDDFAGGSFQGFYLLCEGSPEPGCHACYRVDQITEPPEDT